MSEWISVSERLPREGEGAVAVYTRSGQLLTAWASYWCGANVGFAGWTFPHPEDDEDEEVVFWKWIGRPE